MTTLNPDMTATKHNAMPDWDLTLLDRLPPGAEIKLMFQINAVWQARKGEDGIWIECTAHMKDSTPQPLSLEQWWQRRESAPDSPMLKQGRVELQQHGHLLLALVFHHDEQTDIYTLVIEGIEELVPVWLPLHQSGVLGTPADRVATWKTELALIQKKTKIIHYLLTGENVDHCEHTDARICFQCRKG